MRYLIIVFILVITACTDKEMEIPILENPNNIRYTRHEFRLAPEEVQGDLFTLVYDIPYFDACGVFPPMHVANQIFMSGGGGDAGMSPGASWEPFSLNEEQYNNLLQKVLKQPPQVLKGNARFTQIQFIIDPFFDKYIDRFDWLKAVCEEYRERHHAEIINLQKAYNKKL